MLSNTMNKMRSTLEVGYIYTRRCGPQAVIINNLKVNEMTNKDIIQGKDKKYVETSFAYETNVNFQLPNKLNVI